MSVRFQPATGRASARSAATRPARPGPAPWTWSVDVFVAVAALGLGLTVGSAVISTTRSQLSAPGGLATFLGSIIGLVGTYLALVMVLLVSRIPAIERALGQDGLLRWHRRLAPWPLSLIFLHAVLVTYGYAEAARTGAMHELGILVGNYTTLLLATVALGLMVGIGIVSIRAIRLRLRRETWWSLHLFMYLALSMGFVHEIALGPSFVGHPLAVVLWSAAWAATAGLVIAYRFFLPIWRTLHHRLRIVEVHPEAPGVVSIVCAGRNLDGLAISGGQFFLWRFLSRGIWWQAHPFTVSARPRPPHLRLTVKAVGDYSAALANLPPGTKVAIEGPYGAFTAHTQRRPRVALIAGGIGITAARALLEDLPRRSEPIVILRASDEGDLALVAEVEELARQLKGHVTKLIGPRHEVLLHREIRRIVPDRRTRDFYVSGPEGFVDGVRATLAELGVQSEAVHYEAYSL